MFIAAKASCPFPPVIFIVGFDSYAKPGSIILMSFKDPLTATNPVAPVPTLSVIFVIGGLISRDRKNTEDIFFRVRDRK